MLAILVQPCIANFNPPMWPCNTEHDVHSVHENMHSPEWFKQASPPVDIQVPAIRQFIDIGSSWRPNYAPLFTGLGPFAGKNTLAVYDYSAVVTWKPPTSLYEGEVQRYEFDSQSLTLGADFPPFTSAGFVPHRDDEWVWLTVRGFARVFVVYLPGLSRAVYHDAWAGSVGVGLDAFLGCYPSQLDWNSGFPPAVTFACMSSRRVHLLESRLSLVVSPIPGRGMVISVSTEIRMSFAITAPPSVQGFPIFITKQVGLGMPGVLVYRCGSSSFDIWCTRRYQSYMPSAERTLITSDFLGQTESGIFLGGVYGSNSIVVYFLDRASLVLHTFDLAALHSRPVNSMRLSQPHPQRPVFGGLMWHYQHAGHLSKFSLSHDNKVVFYEREVCKPCVPCKEGVEFSSTLCDPLHNVDSVCESCMACSAGQFIVEGTCRSNLDTSCEWCRFHHPCGEDCGSQECPYGEYVTDRCDGLAVLPGGSSGPAACTACDGACPYNQYMGLDCSCLLCATGTGDCSPGQFIGGCTGPGQDTCTDCKYHPSARPCPADHYHAQVN